MNSEKKIDIEDLISIKEHLEEIINSGEKIKSQDISRHIVLCDSLIKSLQPSHIGKKQ